MAALTADTEVMMAPGATTIHLKAVGADTFYKGAILVQDITTGFVQVPTAGGADEFVGICAEQVTTTAQGDEVLVHIDGMALLAYSSAAQADEGDLLFRDISADSDNPSDLLAATAAASADVAIGRIVRFESGDSGSWVRLHDKSTTATGA